jgi:hypothetical protein
MQTVDSKLFTGRRGSIHFGARLGGLRAQYSHIKKKKAATGLPQSNAKIIPNGIIAKKRWRSRENFGDVKPPLKCPLSCLD